MSDFPNSVEGAGAVRYINPDSLNKNPAFTNVVVAILAANPGTYSET